jgi:hypothetical protein
VQTWHGMPACADADGTIVVLFQDAGTFSAGTRPLGFGDAANLDEVTSGRCRTR